MKGRLLLFITTAAFIVLAAVVVTLASALSQSFSSLLKPSHQPSPSPSQTATPQDEDTKLTEFFESEALGVKVAYPKETKVQENPDKSLALLYFGPTQVEGTELFDGIAIIISKGSFEGDFEAFVKAEAEKRKSDPATSSVSEVGGVSLENLSGFEFTEVGLGEFKNLYLTLDENSYLMVSVLVSDPGNLGFEDLANEILNNLEPN